MARPKCRDCKRCTESTARGCFMALPRAFVESLARAFLWPFRKICPICGHPLAWHSRDSAGRFHD